MESTERITNELPPHDHPEGDLRVGDEAPDFELKRLHGEGAVKLSDFKGKKPVFVIFGSYT